jgi:ferredoxin-NADP reductase/ferredoxin
MSPAATRPAGFSIVLVTSDGARRRLCCGSAMTVLEAAEQAGMILPSLCQSGSCGSCVADVSDGEFLLGSHSEQALGRCSPPAATLLCRTYPRGDCTIVLPYDSSRIGDSLPAVRGATIARLETVAHATIRLDLSLAPAADGSPGAEFDAGQVVALQLPGRPWKRVYSLANTSNWDGSLELYIRLQPEGLFSTYLVEEASVGDALIVHGPQGAFGLHENGTRSRWFVGGGTGIAPLLSMLRRMAEWGDPQPARLYAGFNDEDEVFGTDLFDKLDAELPDFRAEICVWKPTGGGSWSGYRGTPVDALTRDLLNEPQAPDVYICGPPALIDAASDALTAHGVPATQIFSKRIMAN